MIAANAYNWYEHLSFNWFDIVLALVLAFGVWRGRKNGMSKEVLPTVTWVVIILAAGFGAPLAGDWLVQKGYANKVFGGTFVPGTAADIVCYLFIASSVYMAFSPLRTKYREKLAGSNTFGGGEYYLGMISGMIRFGCITLFFLALVNAPVYSTAEIEAQKAYNQRWYGGGQKDFKGDFFPSLSDIQSDIFVKSLTGRIIKTDLNVVLLGNSLLSKKARS